MPSRTPDRTIVAQASVTLAALALYIATACPWVLGGDVGEFATLAAKGGVAHPPGYPLFTLVLRSLSWLPGASPAESAARATGACAALGVLAVFAACRSWRASVEASSLASVVFAVSSTQWLLATQAEVFALNAALAMGLVAAAGPESRARGTRRAVLLGVLFGLGLAHHHTVVATLPVVVVGLIRALREDQMRLRGLGFVAVGLLLGLAPYAEMVWASHHAVDGWVWGDPMGMVGLVQHFTRAEYWRAPDGRAAAFTSQHWAALAAQTGDDLTRPLLALALLGGAFTLVREPRLRAGWSIFASALLAGPGFLWMVTHSGGMGARITAPTGVNRLFIERFYLLPEALLGVPLAWGVDQVLTRVKVRAWRVVACLLVALAAVAVALPGGRTRLRDHQERTVERYLVDSLASAPPGAIVIGTGDHRFFGFLYVQRVLGLRQDVLYVDAGFVRTPWYRRRVEAALTETRVTPANDDETLVDRALASGRPVLIADEFDGSGLEGRPHYAVGTLVRILPVGTDPPDLDALEAMNLDVFARFTRDAMKPRDPWGWAGEADEAYARPWLALAAAFTKRGDTRRAQQESERAWRRGL